MKKSEYEKNFENIQDKVNIDIETSSLSIHSNENEKSLKLTSEFE